MDRGSETTGEQVVAGTTVLVVAFVALNLLAQRFGAMRASGALDYYLTPADAAERGGAGHGRVLRDIRRPGDDHHGRRRCLVYRLPLGRLWLLMPVIVLAGAALAGVGALLGLLAPRPEIATVAGQLGHERGALPGHHSGVADAAWCCA